jgi:hypothetical protein
MIRWTNVAFMATATVAALIAIIMPAVANASAPSKSDTIQTWTCRWRGAVGAPENFGPLCRESVRLLFLSCICSSFQPQLFSNALSCFVLSGSLTRYLAILLLCFHPTFHRSSSALDSEYPRCRYYTSSRADS